LSGVSSDDVLPQVAGFVQNKEVSFRHRLIEPGVVAQHPLKQPAEYRGYSTISAIDRQDLNQPLRQYLQRRQNVGRGVSHDMMDRWLTGN
jgi:hypothetical protein